MLLLRQESNGETFYRCSWREFRDQAWRAPASGKEVFSDLEFGSDIELQLELEGLAVPALVDAEDAEPQFILYSSGETTVGAIDVRGRSNGELLWRLEWDLLGRFDLLRQGVPEDDGG